MSSRTGWARRHSAHFSVAPLSFYRERLLARRADQHVEQFLGEHRWIVLPRLSAGKGAEQLGPRTIGFKVFLLSKFSFLNLPVFGGTCLPSGLRQSTHVFHYGLR